MLLLHAAHHHTQVTSFANHANANRIDGVLNSLRHVLREPLLDLEAPREDIHQAWELTQSDHLVSRQAGDVHLPAKPQQVILAKADGFASFYLYHPARPYH